MQSDSRQSERWRTWILGLLVFIVILLATFGIVSEWPKNSLGEGLGEPTNSADPEATVLTACGSSASSIVATNSPPPRSTGDSTPVDELKPEDVESPGVDPWQRTIRIKLVDTADNPVPGLSVRFGTAREVRRHRLPQDPGYFDRNWLGETRRTGIDGVIEIPNIAMNVTLVFVLDDTSWLVCGVTNSSPDSEALPTNGWSLDRGSTEQRVMVQRPCSIVLTMCYADGAPVTGTIRYSVWMRESTLADQETGYTREPIRVAEASYVEIGMLPATGRVWGHVASIRSGFAMRTVFDFRIEAGEEQEIVVPRDDSPRGGLEIDLSELADDETVSVLVKAESGLEVYQATQKGPGLMVTPNIRVFSEVVRVFVFGVRAWKSEAVDLSTVDGEWVRVVAHMEAPGTVRFRVTNSAGQPLHPAVALYDSSGYVRWLDAAAYEQAVVSAGQMRRHFACADPNGVIEYSGLPSGRYEFAVEAQGYVRSCFECMVSGGLKTDLGDVVLVQATSANSGTITVVLEGIHAADSYRVRLDAPITSSGLLPSVQVDKGGVARFERLNLRSYKVSIEKAVPDSGEPPELKWWSIVALSKEKLTIVLTIRQDTPRRISEE